MPAGVKDSIATDERQGRLRLDDSAEEVDGLPCLSHAAKLIMSLA